MMKKVILTLFTAGLLLPIGQLMAKKDCPGHPSCGDETPLPVTEVDNTAEHTGLIFESATASAPNYHLTEFPRLCDVAVTQLNKGMVHYECEAGGLVSINFSGWTTISGEQGYCDLLDTAINPSQEFREFTPTRYWYRNDSECDRSPGGVCEIRISKISFRGQKRGPGTDTGPTHQYVDLGAYGLEDVGRINIRTWAQLVPLEDEGNVFAVDHTIDLPYIAVEFRAVRNGATLANCRVEQYSEYLPGDARLTTTVYP